MDITPKTTPPVPRSAEEIEALKNSWCNDPNWDMEDTEGFDLHRDDLVGTH